MLKVVIPIAPATIQVNQSDSNIQAEPIASIPPAIVMPADFLNGVNAIAIRPAMKTPSPAVLYCHSIFCLNSASA